MGEKNPNTSKVEYITTASSMGNLPALV
jgi:hypothetical protein